MFDFKKLVPGPQGKLWTFRIATLFTAMFAQVGSHINRGVGLNEPLPAAIGVTVISLLIFGTTWHKIYRNTTFREWSVTVWSLTIGAFNGLNILLNGPLSTYTVPLIGLAVIVVALHDRPLPMAVSVGGMYLINFSPVFVFSYPSIENPAFLLIAATFFFGFVLLSRLASIGMQGEIDQQNLLLAQRSEELEKQNQELEKVSYVLSHDLKSPIRGIKSLIAFTLEDLEEEGVKIPPEILNNLHLISKRADKLESLVQGILAYSKAGIKKEKKVVSIQDTLDQCLEHLEVPQGFEIAIQGMDQRLEFNPTELYQVFQNLLSNALKYNDKAQGRIEVSMSRSGKMIKIGFKDFGKGIPLAYHEKAFDLFETLDSEDSAQNTGVGLAIVKRILEANQGSISLSSEPGEWTEFVLSIPAQSRK